MKLLRYDGPWQLSLQDGAKPQPQPNEILLRSEAVGICGSDVHGYTGESGRRKPGMVMGHEAVGRVVEVGPGVQNHRTGDLVAIFPTLGCGHCRHCLAGMEHICPDKRIIGVNAGTWGAMAEFFTCHSSQAYTLDPTIDPAIGILAEPVAVALHAIELMKPQKDWILSIVGTGTIGLAVIVVLKHLGFKSIFVLDKIKEKLDFAQSLGAIPLTSEQGTPVEALTKLAGRRSNGVFEAVGSAPTVRLAYDLCDFGGSITLIGNLAKEFTLPLQGLTSNEITLRGSYGFTRAEFQRAVGIASENRDVLAKFITGTCSLAETPSVMSRLAHGELHALKMVIKPQDN